MDYTFVCNTLTFENLNGEIKKEIDKICNGENAYIDKLKECLSIFTNTEYWNAPESDGITALTQGIMSDLDNCKDVLNSYMNLLEETREKAREKIKSIQDNNTATDGAMLNEYYQR